MVGFLNHIVFWGRFWPKIIYFDQIRDNFHIPMLILVHGNTFWTLYGQLRHPVSGMIAGFRGQHLSLAWYFFCIFNNKKSGYEYLRQWPHTPITSPVPHTVSDTITLYVSKGELEIYKKNYFCFAQTLLFWSSANYKRWMEVGYHFLKID